MLFFYNYSVIHIPIHWSVDPPTAHGLSLPGIFPGYKTFVGFYISLQRQSGMVLGSEVIFNMEYAAGPGQVVLGEDAQGEHDQAGFGTGVPGGVLVPIIRFPLSGCDNLKSSRMGGGGQCGRGRRQCQFGVVVPPAVT